MIAAAAAWLIGKGVSARLAKPLLFVIAGALVLAVLGVGKCAYDRSVIEEHDQQREAATAKADRKADTKAADQRRIDDARVSTEKQEIDNAIEQAKREGRDPRAVYYECIASQQAARRRGASVPSC